MTIRDAKGEIIDKIPVKNVLISVFDKSGLEEFVRDLAAVCPEVQIMSTGGTYKKLKEASTPNLIEVAEYTGFPEMEGGLVKTLHPKIHAGILAERNNPAHQQYLKAMNGQYIDMVVVNLYPFQEIIKKIEAGEINPQTKKPYDFESARGNIDIGGPTMIRAAAKNFLSCAAICDPKDYAMVMNQVEDNEGCTTFDQRIILASKVFKMTSEYDTKIAEWAAKQKMSEAKANYKFKGE